MKKKTTFLFLLTLAPLWSGCNASHDETGSSDPVVSDLSSDSDGSMPPMMGVVDEHPDDGPHGGELIELGKEAFHAELVHEEGVIQIYVLDGLAEGQVAIDSENLMLSLKRNAQVTSFRLAATPDTNDPAGQASRFTSSDPQLNEWLDAGAQGAVVLQIDGKSYTGKVAHDHDHSDHDGSGHDHSDHGDEGHGHQGHDH